MRGRITAWIHFYGGRPHQALGDRTPMAVWREGVIGVLRATRGHDAELGRRCRVAHMPTATTTAVGFILTEQDPPRFGLCLRRRKA